MDMNSIKFSTLVLKAENKISTYFFFTTTSIILYLHRILYRHIHDATIGHKMQNETPSSYSTYLPTKDRKHFTRPPKFF